MRETVVLAAVLVLGLVCGFTRGCEYGRSRAVAECVAACRSTP